jgi:hypothetical protein
MRRLANADLAEHRHHDLARRPPPLQLLQLAA